MRKPSKSQLRNYLLTIESIQNPNPDVSVIDGSDLLYHTSWSQQFTFEDIVANYVAYIKKNLRHQLYGLFLMETTIKIPQKKTNIQEDQKD